MVLIIGELFCGLVAKCIAAAKLDAKEPRAQELWTEILGQLSSLKPHKAATVELALAQATVLRLVFIRIVGPSPSVYGHSLLDGFVLDMAEAYLQCTSPSFIPCYEAVCTELLSHPGMVSQQYAMTLASSFVEALMSYHKLEGMFQIGALSMSEDDLAAKFQKHSGVVVYLLPSIAKTLRSLLRATTTEFNTTCGISTGEQGPFDFASSLVSVG